MNIIPLAFLYTITGVIKRTGHSLLSHSSYSKAGDRCLTGVTTQAEESSIGGQHKGMEIWKYLHVNPALPMTSKVNLDKAYDLSKALLPHQRGGDNSAPCSGLI